MVPEWAELFVRVWAIARIAFRAKRKAYRRLARRWRFRDTESAPQDGAVRYPRGELKPGAVIPNPTGYVGVNDLLKQIYTDRLMPHPSPFLPSRERIEVDELDENAFIFPCHRGLN